MLANHPQYRLRGFIEDGEYVGMEWRQYKELEDIHFAAYGDKEKAVKFANDFVCRKEESKHGTS